MSAHKPELGVSLHTVVKPLAEEHEEVIDWFAFVSALGETGYTGPFNYEARPNGDTPEEKIADLQANFARLAALPCP